MTVSILRLRVPEVLSKWLVPSHDLEFAPVVRGEGCHYWRCSDSDMLVMVIHFGPTMTECMQDSSCALYTTIWVSSSLYGCFLYPWNIHTQHFRLLVPCGIAYQTCPKRHRKPCASLFWFLVGVRLLRPLLPVKHAPSAGHRGRGVPIPFWETRSGCGEHFLDTQLGSSHTWEIWNENTKGTR